MTSRVGLLTTLLVLAFLGIADAWYLALSAFEGAALVCDVGAALDGCNIVAQSPYSHLFGIPVALYGVIFYCVLFVLVAVLFVRTHHPLYQAVAALGVLGLAASIVFLLIQFVLIKAVCIYCIASAVIAGLICLFSLLLRHHHAPKRGETPSVIS